MAKDSKNTVTTEEAKNYCKQRRDESFTNVLNTQITIPGDGDGQGAKTQSLGELFTVGEGDNAINVLDHLLRQDTPPTEEAIQAASENNEEPPKPTPGFKSLLSQQHKTLFEDDAEMQKELQKDNYQPLLKGDMDTYDSVVQDLNDNRDKALAQLDKDYEALNAKLTGALDEIKGYFYYENGDPIEDLNAVFKSIKERFDIDDDDAAKTIASQLVRAYAATQDPIGDDEETPLDKAKATLAKNLNDTKEKEKHKIKRLYQQRLNNLKKVVNETDAMMAFRDQQRLVGRMDRGLLRTDETDADIDRRHTIDFNHSSEFEYKAMVAQLEQEKAQGQGKLTLPGSKSPGILSNNGLINIDWQYNANNDTYTFSCNLSSLDSKADKETAVKGLISSAVARGATWIDISNIGDDEFLSSATSGTFADTKSGIKSIFGTSGMKKKMSLMAVAVEEAAFRGIKPGNIRGAIIGPQNPKLLEAYQEGMKRRMAMHKSNGTFSLAANRDAAIALEQYSEVQGTFVERAIANGFDVSEQVQQIFEENPQVAAALAQASDIEKMQYIASQSPQFASEIQKQLDNFVKEYNGEEDGQMSKEDLLKLRNDAFVEWAKADEKEDKQGIHLQQRYQHWQENKAERMKNISQRIKSVEPRLEDKKKGKDRNPPGEGMIPHRERDENQEDRPQERPGP